MPRTRGAKNVIPFSERTSIPVSSAQAIQRRGSDQSPLEQFKARVYHQQNYLIWLRGRHNKIIDLNAKLVEAQTGQPPSRKGAKDATHGKYLWFAECMALLDIINSFEYFYKVSCIGLATALTDIVSADQIKGSVEARFIWQSRGYSPQHLIFEHHLFHDLKHVNEITRMLIGKERYNTQLNNSTYRCIQAIFQIRHTLSHNSGQVTKTDATKLKVFGFDATPDGAIDPQNDNFGKAIFGFLIKEAESFTDWLEKETVKYMREYKGSDTILPVYKSHLLRLFSGSKSFDTFKLIT